MKRRDYLRTFDEILSIEVKDSLNPQLWHNSFRDSHPSTVPRCWLQPLAQ